MITDKDLLKQVLLDCNNNAKIIKESDSSSIAKSYEEFDTEQSTPIQQFYNNQIIFITGGTGFLGKILIEKLLRCCSDITKIYVLVRQKKGKDIQERIQDLLNDSVFDGMRPKLRDLEKKIVGVAGDCTMNNLGLNNDDVEILTEQVSIVFHVAATVRFDEKLKQAAATNLQSTSSILNLCKDMKHLKSFVHVSTAYANCFTSEIEEKFYDYSIQHEELLRLVEELPEEMVNAITPQIIRSWPNTYTFTKALAENLVRTESQNLPIGIFRPGIVTSAAHEPTPGWTDNYNGPTGVIAGAATGMLRTMHINTTRIANLVPVDLTVNALIASAWDVSTQTNRRGEDMLIYNFSSTSEAPLSWDTFIKNSDRFIKEYPLKMAMWCYVFQATKYKFLYYIYSFFLHYVPGLFIDFIARIFGRQPKFQRTYQKVYKMFDALNHFCMNEWKFNNDNVQNMWIRLDTRDQLLFKFTMRDFDWSKYMSNYVKGIRIFLFKDNLETLESSKKKYKWLTVSHKILVTSLHSLALWTVWKMMNATFLS